MESPRQDNPSLQALPFAFPIFLSAFLLFEVQPLIAKYILPWYGGTPAVWTTCLLFFQVFLLGGYAYAHLISSRLSLGAQKRLHVLLLMASILLLIVLGRLWETPITPGAGWTPQGGDEPVRHIVLLLLVSVGLPYFILSSTGPLLQSWFSHHFPRTSPYRLYALSNLGSLLALVGYPFAIEWLLPLKAGARAWAWTYGAFALSCGFCALQLRAQVATATAVPNAIPPPEKGVDDSAPAPLRRGLWLALAACASTMLLATTNQLCLGVAAVPFLWVLPLVLYLLSFIICFENERWYRREVFQPALGLGAALACYALFRVATLSLPWQIAIYSLALFASCMVCHGELVRLKPATRHLTSFYLLVAAGGALGGVFVSLLAPHLFSGYWEYHLGLWGSVLLMFVVLWLDETSWLNQKGIWLPASIILAACLFPVALAFLIDTTKVVKDWRFPLMVLIAVVLLVRLMYGSRSEAHGHTSSELAKFCMATTLSALGGVLAMNYVHINLVAIRNFYGVLSVAEPAENDPAWRTRQLLNGPILHGFQFLDPAKRRYRTSYYGRLSGVGLAFLNHPKRRATRPEDRHLRIGAIGLGTGSLAVYAEPGDTIRFYEINPEVYRVASTYFTYLHDCPARVEVVLGDARLSMQGELARDEPQQFDLLALDAFSGDAIPVHLLTREAFEVYLRHLSRPSGLIAVHISNHFLDLRPVLWKVAEKFGLQPAWVHSPQEERVAGPSDWVLLALDGTILEAPEVAKAIELPKFLGGPIELWTDDYSNLFRVLQRHESGSP